MDIPTILSLIRPGEIWRLAGTTYADLEWLDVTVKPTLAEIQSADANFIALKAPKDRDAAIIQLNADTSPNSKFIRAIMLILVDEINLLREQFEALKAANTAASTYAGLKSGIQGLPAMPDRTPAQARNAIQNKISNGSAD